MPGLFRGVESIFRPPFSLARSLVSLARACLACRRPLVVDRVTKSGESNGCDFIFRKLQICIRDLKSGLDYSYHHEEVVKI